MIAYHNDPAIKAKYLARVAAHRIADRLIQGTGWEDGKGCAVGCTLESYEHSRYPIELGIPLQLAYLEDRLFELQSVDASQVWPERFLSIRPGADLSQVWPQWAVWMLVDETHGVIRHAKGRPNVEAAIRRIAELWRVGGTAEEFRQARRRHHRRRHRRRRRREESKAVLGFSSLRQTHLTPGDCAMIRLESQATLHRFDVMLSRDRDVALGRRRRLPARAWYGIAVRLQRIATRFPEAHRPKYEGRAKEAWLRWERGQRQVVAVDGVWVRWAA